MKRLLSYIVTGFVAASAQFLDNRDTCAHRVVNCDPQVDHFETKISIEHASSVSRLQYENTHVLLEQSWPTRGPWMKATNQKVILVRCGCPIPEISPDWVGANIIHVPVSSVMVQMPSTLTKFYMMGQRSKVTAVESTRFLSDGTPEVVSDIRDGTLVTLDRAPNGQPSTLIKLSFSGSTFSSNSTGFRLHLTSTDCTATDDSCFLQSTSCIYPAVDDGMALDEKLHEALSSFNSIPEWTTGGNIWTLSKGVPDNEPSTSLSYEVYFDFQLPMSLGLQGDASECGIPDMEVIVNRDVASSRNPIYHRLHDLSGGFPDVLVTEPRSLGPLADDPKILARQFLDSDPGEETPLGRAELMKLTSILVGSESTGNSLFDLIKTRYMRAKEIAMTAKYRPTVMVGKPGTWNEAARSSWMITVGSTYVGQFLRDANVEYRNADDSINEQVCGSGCGVCPSGTSDTRCSVPIDEYLELFRWADYWISAGIGANCWSASCNFEITSDELLNQNREIFSQFLPMRCGSVLALDKAHGPSGNPYWDIGRLRPDLILEDIVALMHPDVEIQGETTFFRKLPIPQDLSGVEECPRTLLPPKPEKGSVHITASFVMKAEPPSEVAFMGSPEFSIYDKLYSNVNSAVARKLNVNLEDMEIRMMNRMDLGFFPFAVTVRVSNCPDHKCGLEIGQDMNALDEVIVDALDIPWISGVKEISTLPVVVVDEFDDRIPLIDLLPEEKDTHEKPEPEPMPEPVKESKPESSEVPITKVEENSDGGVSKVGLGVGIAATVLVYVVSIVFTYKIAFAKGVETKSPPGMSTDGGMA